MVRTTADLDGEAGFRKLWLERMGDDGPLFLSDVSAADGIASIKAKVEAETGISADQQRLIFAENGRELENGRTLSDYNIIVREE